MLVERRELVHTYKQTACLGNVFILDIQGKMGYASIPLIYLFFFSFLILPLIYMSNYI